MFNITWWTCYIRALAWGLLNEDMTGIILNFFSKGVKYYLNSEPLWNTNFCGCGYLHSHVLLNIWLTLEDDLSMYSSLPSASSSRSNIDILKISNQPVLGSTIVIQVRLELFRMTVLPRWCCLIDLLYGPIRSTCTVSHHFSSAIFPVGWCP